MWLPRGQAAKFLQQCHEKAVQLLAVWRRYCWVVLHFLKPQN
jgi:hypothetical protein